MKRYTLTLDLKGDPVLISEYETLHKQVWPEIKNSIRESGIQDMFIYRYHTRLFMLIYVEDDFSFENKEALDLANPRVQEWEALMSTFQESIPTSSSQGKWQLMQQIFDLNCTE